MNLSISKNSLTDNKLRLIYTSIFVILALLAIWAGYIGSNFNYIDDSNTVQIDCNNFSPSFSAHRITTDEIGLKNYVYHFSESLLSDIQDSEYKLIIHKVTDNAIRIYLNDMILLSEGDFENGNSLFKGSSISTTIDHQLIQDKNTIRIETYALYKSGSEAPFVLICKNKIGMKIINSLVFFNEKLVSIGIGILFFSALFPIYIYIISVERDRTLIYCALATLFLIFYFSDYQKIIHLRISFFTWKRICLLSLSNGVFYYVLAIRRFVRKPILVASVATLTVYYVVILFLSDNMVQFKTLYEYWYIALVFNILLFLIYIGLNVKNNNRAFIFLIAFTMLGVYSAFVVLIEFQNGYFIISSPLLYMMILATLPLLIGFDAISEKDKTIVREQELKEHVFLTSLTDNLTGTWNRRYIDLKFSEIDFDYAIAMFDFDDFKMINDNYGHQAGDFILKEVSSLILKNIRETDQLCRYGGDEFILLFDHCDISKANDIMEKLRILICNAVFLYNQHELKITLSIGIYYNENADMKTYIAQADKALYQAKNSGKNKIIVNSEL